ncbi:transposase [Bacteroides acidifaciens]|uniref:transposase n=1 Tax=Bacteroides acidifaciens TaxID=85831 RepID=UPI0033901F2B
MERNLKHILYKLNPSSINSRLTSKIQRSSRQKLRSDKIEAKNSELKNVFGYDRADSYGMDCMHMQGAMVIFAANIKRILRLS